ncbi:glycosyl hydrolase 115 family protein [Parapedobacter sp. 10938]|uniref:glycosyl hydrolase 115 family protein n=1 Tax=Parapedobacter flavus TaxID=3110225 RepID=UPI002DB76A66|nr:glycosyl hydrolase 115 family protein [Parapedobacter sp. 10938]MEC3878175.1 glycosyl hydrolase 115 family protein [Parapedobacter sp. 10938]
MNLSSYIRAVFIPVFCVFLATGAIKAQVSLVETAAGQGDVFPLSTKGQTTSIYYDTDDFTSVKTSTQLFAADVERVTGRSTSARATNTRLTKNMVLVGSLGNNKLIDELVANNKLSVAEIEGGWEQYTIQLVHNPFAGVAKALVVVGSDRRGAAYGLFSISETIGVSPWYWWADVPVKQRRILNLQVSSFSSSTPTVKYRGVFINDEDWGLLPWAKHTFDPELGDIGPKTYAKVFELLLRLKANYLCPAMHEASGAFNKYAENKAVADSFGIVMGSVHPEPLLFNNASEWDKETMGDWNYMTNKEGILKVLDQRVKENSPYENVYTLALRGLHDKAMTGGYSLDQRVALVNEALQDQRKILEKYIDKPIEKIPQAFTPYKEVLDLYMAGLDLPEDVILVWPDDNYGYMKQLSNAEEQKRSGGSGVYYHASYLGMPHDYLWISSTPPALMYEELYKAYNTGANQLWLLNAGDIKSCESPVSLFLAMAYDIHQFDFDNVSDYQAKWLSSIYGQSYYDDFREITHAYNRLAFIRKPEFMGWGYEWNTFSHGTERPTDTEFSFANYGEAEKRIADYSRIGAMAEHILNALPEEERASFFQLLYYPVKGAELMNKKWLTAQRQRMYVAQGRAGANQLRDQVRHYYDTLYTISYEYNDMLDGKWKRVLSIRQGVTASYFKMPELDSVAISPEAGLGIAVQGQEVLKGRTSYYALPAFNQFLDKTYFVDLFNTGSGSFDWHLKPSHDWVVVNKTSGTVTLEDRVWVSIDWSKVPVGERISGHIEIYAGDTKEEVLVSVFNPASPALGDVQGLYIEDNGVISIAGADFQRKRESDDIKMQVIDNLGVEGQSVMIGDPTAEVRNPRDPKSPGVEYDFYTFHRGQVDVYTYVLPIFPLSSDRDFGFHEQGTGQTRYAVSIDDGPVALPSSSAPEYTQAWLDNVLRNAAVNKSTFFIDTPGKHTLHIKCGDPGMVIQKIVLDFGGMKKSYIGPSLTKVK